MSEITINPSVPLADPEWAAALERKRQLLLRDSYRPAKMPVPWPKPAPHDDVPAARRGCLRVVK